jgi:proliferating cell nuclear antigen
MMIYAFILVVINANKEQVRFSANGEIGTGNITLKQTTSSDGKEADTKFDVQEQVNLAFALRYLGFFTKASPLSSQVRLSLSKDGISPFPIIICLTN